MNRCARCGNEAAMITRKLKHKNGDLSIGHYCASCFNDVYKWVALISTLGRRKKGTHLHDAR